jgi:hypothetical protein
LIIDNEELRIVGVMSISLKEIMRRLTAFLMAVVLFTTTALYTSKPQEAEASLLLTATVCGIALWKILAGATVVTAAGVTAWHYQDEIAAAFNQSSISQQLGQALTREQPTVMQVPRALLGAMINNVGAAVQSTPGVSIDANGITMQGNAPANFASFTHGRLLGFAHGLPIISQSQFRNNGYSYVDYFSRATNPAQAPGIPSPLFHYEFYNILKYTENVHRFYLGSDVFTFRPVVDASSTLTILRNGASAGFTNWSGNPQYGPWHNVFHSFYLSPTLNGNFELRLGRAHIRDAMGHAPTLPWANHPMHALCVGSNFFLPSVDIAAPIPTVTMPLDLLNHFMDAAANQARIDTLAGLNPTTATDNDLIHIYIPPMTNIEDLLSLTLEQLIINNSAITDAEEGYITIPNIYNPAETITVPLIAPAAVTHPDGPGTGNPDVNYEEIMQKLLDTTGSLLGVLSGFEQATRDMNEYSHGLLKELMGVGQGIQSGVQGLSSTLADSMATTMTNTIAAQQAAQAQQVIRTPLTTVFPFSIPFSFAAALSSLNAPPKTPRWEIDFSGTVLSGDYWDNSSQSSRIVIDMAEFETIAQVVRWGTFLSFAFGLMMATRKFITW